MAKFVLAYLGGSMPEGEAAQKAVMEQWMGWFGQLGAAIVDGGAPFGASKAIASNGAVSDGGKAGLTGYSILEAGSIDEAATMAKGCPVLSSGGTVEVYEAMPVM
jgi:hypothetical protein